MLYPYRSSLRPLIPAAMVTFGLASGAAAVSVDITTPGSTGTVNGALFTQGDFTNADVGSITGFLRLQGHAGTVIGYNTDAHPAQFDEKTNFTHSILLASVPVVLKDGVYYREFLLNNREPAATSKHLISLDGLSLFLSPNGSPSGVSLLNPAAALGLPVYSLDAGGDNAVLMDASLNKGGNHYDVAVDIPVADFPASSNSYVTLLATFGIADASNGAYEEFAIGTFTTTIPSPDPVPLPIPAAALTGLSTLALLAAIPTANRLRRRLA